MATPYFDASAGSKDLRKLPDWAAGGDLADLALTVEAAIVAHYTIDTYDGPAYAFRETEQGWVLDGGPLAGMVKLDDNLYVTLRGYSETPATAEARFKAAFINEIAAVLTWRVAQSQRRPGVTSASDGDKSQSFAENADSLFPPGFPQFLGPFDVQGELYAI